MKTLLKFLLLFFLSYGASAQVTFPKCNAFLPPPEPQTYTVPTFGEAATTASAFLKEYMPGKNKTLDGCIIILKAGTVFEIDIPLCLEKVTIIAEGSSVIRIQSRQTLTLYNCILEPVDKIGYWNGITRENESAKVKMYNCWLSGIDNAATCLPGL